jgi:hypothetical protein
MCYNIRLEVHTTMILKSSVFRDITLCSLLKELCLLLASCWFLVWIILRPWRFFQNVGWLSTDYSALYPKRSSLIYFPLITLKTSSVIPANLGIFETLSAHLVYCFCWFLAWLTLRPRRWKRLIPLKGLAVSELQGVTTQKTIPLTLILKPFKTIFIDHRRIFRV